MLNQIKLNIGCGPLDIRPGYENIDIQPYPGVIVGDITNLKDYKSESIDYIVAQHILEYIPRKSMLKALYECWRVLKPGSNMEVRVLDIGLVCKALYLNQVSSEMGLYHEMVISLLYGLQEDEYNKVLNGFTAEFLQGVLVGIGFKTIGIAYENYDVIVSCQRVS